MKLQILTTVIIAALQLAAAPCSAQERTGAAAQACDAGSNTQLRRALAWSDYEFGRAEGLPMGLQARGCYSQAAEASRDYLAFGPKLDIRQQAITTFHMGRNLALAGREAEAALAVAASRRSDQAPGGLDWNRYVQGVYAFLIKDAAALELSLSSLSASGADSDRTNAANLRQLKQCFSRSYLAAMNDPACAAGADAASH